MNIVHRQPLTRTLRVLVLAPVPLLILFAWMVGSGSGTGEGDPVVGMVLLLLIALLPVGFAFSGAAFCRVRGDRVTVGFSPVYRRSFPRTEVAEAEVVAVDPMSYGGWGVKGSSRKEQGMLFSAGGQHAVSLRLKDGRRYLVGCGPQDAEASRIVALLAPASPEAPRRV